MLIPLCSFISEYLVFSADTQEGSTNWIMNIITYLDLKIICSGCIKTIQHFTQTWYLNFFIFGFSHLPNEIIK